MKYPEAQRVRTLRGKETLRDFAEKFEVSGSNIQVIEAGKQGLAVPLARKIANLYNVTLDWLYAQSEEGGPKIDSDNNLLLTNNRDINNTMNMSMSSSTSNNEVFLKQLIEEKDQRIQMYEAFLKNREEDLSHCREQVTYFKNLYDQANNKK